MLFRAIMALCILASDLGFAAPRCESGLFDGVSCQPFRANFLKLSPSTDVKKPLGAASYGGIRLTQDMLISAPDPRWVGGYSFKKHDFIWWHEFPAEVTAPIAAFGIRVIVSTYDGKLTSLDALTGRKLWETDLGRFADREMSVFDKTIFVQTASNQLFAVNGQSGQKLWVYDAGYADDISIRLAASPAFAERKIYMGTTRGEVHVIDQATGQMMKRYSLKKGGNRFYDIIGEIVVEGDHLLISRYDGLVAKVRLESQGEQASWQQNLPSVSASRFHEGIYFIGCTNGEIHALDGESGKELWQVPTGEAIANITIGDKVLYVAGSNGQISVFDAKSGNLNWVDHLRGAIDTSPILFGNQIYYTTGMSNLYSYKVR